MIKKERGEASLHTRNGSGWENSIVAKEGKTVSALGEMKATTSFHKPEQLRLLVDKCWYPQRFRKGRPS